MLQYYNFMVIKILLEDDYNLNIDAFNILEPFLKVLHICLTYLYNFCLLEVFAKEAFLAVSHIVLVPLLISSGKKMLSQVFSALNIISYIYLFVTSRFLFERPCWPLLNSVSHIYIRVCYTLFF